MTVTVTGTAENLFRLVDLGLISVGKFGFRVRAEDGGGSGHLSGIEIWLGRSGGLIDSGPAEQLFDFSESGLCLFDLVVVVAVFLLLESCHF